jgi:hypothetical protein
MSGDSGTARLLSKTGSSPPFRYAAVQATMDADGVWTQVDGGAAYNKGGTGVLARELRPWSATRRRTRPRANFKGALGVTADSLGGVDITFPIYKLS